MPKEGSISWEIEKEQTQKQEQLQPSGLLLNQHYAPPKTEFKSVTAMNAVSLPNI